jgi:hypothetical protein
MLAAIHLVTDKHCGSNLRVGPCGSRKNSDLGSSCWSPTGRRKTEVFRFIHAVLCPDRVVSWP